MSSPMVDLAAAQQLDCGRHEWSFTERDVILYALGVGCSWKEGRYVYENHEDFAALPTFGVLALHNGALEGVDLTGVLPNFNPTRGKPSQLMQMLLLHGEQYMELQGRLPTAGTLVSTPKILDVKDKGKAAVVVIETTSVDKDTGAVIAVNETTSFIRGAGGFGKTASVRRRAAAVAQHAHPQRVPDATITEQTSDSQAALYRLSGDYNPLHIDPEFAAGGNFERPILHGLCTFGICCKHILTKFGDGNPAALKSIKGRFAGHVFPGETLRTDMWTISSHTVVFQARVLERDTIAITSAAVVFQQDSPVKRAKL